MTVAVGEPYSALAAVYEQWVNGNPYQAWAEAIHRWLQQPEHVRTVLDICTGTGTMAGLLTDLGYEVTGTDRSPEMIAQARQSLPQISFTQAELPHLPPGVFDAAVCTFDSLNYLDPGLFRETLGAIGGAVRSGGRLVFDVNTALKIRAVFGNSHYGDDLGDFAYVWRNRLREQEQAIDYLITLFRRDDAGTFQRSEEHHTQYWFSDDEISEALMAAGFEVCAVTDDYSDRPASRDSLRQTWFCTRK